ncbi:hypothetical protein GCM10027168_31150 [Streptomyces capparidis]
MSGEETPGADPGVLAAVDALAGRWRARAEQAERERRLPRGTVTELLDAGLLQLAAPPRFGGAGHGWPTLVEAARRAARACPSTGWVVGVVGGHAALAGRLPRQAAEQVFAAGARQVFATASASAGGRVTRVPGGYRVAGRWRFCSAADHADWVLLNGPCPETGDRVLLPLAADRVRVEDNWRVTGMAGTGSKDITVDTVVPDALTGSLTRCFAARRPDGGTAPTAYYLDEVPFLPYINTCVVGPVLGCAEGAWSACLDLLSAGRGGARALDDPLVRDGLTESAAELDCARHLYRAVCARLHGAGAARRAVTPEDAAAVGRDRAYLARLCVRAVHRLVGLGGTAVHAEDHRLGRHWRDLQMMAAHRDLDWSRNAAAWAAEALDAAGPAPAAPPATGTAPEQPAPEPATPEPAAPEPAAPARVRPA